MVLGSSPVAVTSHSDFAPASSKEFLDFQATIECGFTLTCIRDMTRTYSKFPSHTLIIFDIKQQGESFSFFHSKLGWILHWYNIFYCRFQKSLFLDFKKAIYRYICNAYDIIGTKVSN